MRLLTLGSVPSRWGGRSDGGVAEVHAMMAQYLGSQDGECDYLGLVAPNRATGAKAPPVLLNELPEDTRTHRDWYLGLIERLRPDAVLFFHIAHRFALWHAEHARHIAGIGTIHSWTPVTTAPDDQRMRKTATLHKAMAGMQRLVFVSEHCRAEGQALGFDYHGRDCVIPNPLQAAFASPGIAGRSTTERPRILFVGRLEEVKRPWLLLEIAPVLDAEFVFLGDGSLRTRLETRAQELGVASRCHFYGAVSPDSVRAEMLKAELLCVPSSRESFGLVYIEALACGTPIVGYAPAVEEIEQLCGLEIGVGISSCATAEDVLHALKRVLGQDWKRDEIAVAVRARYSIERIIQEYQTLVSSAFME